LSVGVFIDRKDTMFENQCFWLFRLRWWEH